MDRNLIIYIGSAAILAIIIIFISTNLYTNYMMMSSGKKSIAGYKGIQSPTSSKYTENTYRNLEVNRLPVLLIYLKYTSYRGIDTIIVRVNNITIHYKNGQMLTYSGRDLGKSINISLGDAGLITSIPLYPGRIDRIYVNITVNGNDETLLQHSSIDIELDRTYEINLTL